MFILFTGDYMIQKSLRQQYISLQQAQVYSKMGELRAKLEYEVTSSMLLIQSMASYISIYPDLTTADFNRFAKELFERNAHLKNITASPDFVFKYVYPLKGNEALLGKNYKNIPGQWERAKMAAETGKVVLAGPVDLIQGGKGLVGRVPVYNDKGVFWGLVSSVLNFNLMMESISKANSTNPIKFALKGYDVFGNKEDIIYGEPELFSKTDVINMSISIPSGKWRMVAEPVNGWAVSHPHALYVHLITLAMMLLAFYLTIGRIKNMNQMKAARTHEEQIKKQLEQLNSELQDRVKQEVEKNRQHVEMIAEQQRFADMGQMINAIAHQWRQPLNNIRLVMQMLDDMDSGEDYGKTREELYEQHFELVDYMSKTIDDFRNFFSAGKQKQIFSLDYEVARTLRLVQPQLSHYNIRTIQNCSYENNPDDPSDMYFGFMSELRQVLLNIINNAKDALLSVENDVRRIVINIDKKDNNYYLSIFNNGPAIPEDILKKIFVAYFTTKQEKHGSGIGLYMSRTIIENHFNGTLHAENTPDGVIFYIIFPENSPPATLPQN